MAGVSALGVPTHGAGGRRPSKLKRPILTHCGTFWGPNLRTSITPEQRLRFEQKVVRFRLNHAKTHQLAEQRFPVNAQHFGGQ